MMKLIFTFSFFLLVCVTDNKVLCASQTSYSYYYKQTPQNSQYGVGICSDCKTCPGNGFSSYIQVSTPYTPYTPYGSNSPCGPVVPYGSNSPCGPNVPYRSNSPCGPVVPYGSNSPCGPVVPYRPHMPFGPYAPPYDPRNTGICSDCRNQGYPFSCPAQIDTPKAPSKKTNSNKDNKKPGLKKKIEDAIYNGKDALRDYGRNIKSFFQKCGEKVKGAFKKNKKPPIKTCPYNCPPYSPASMHTPQYKWK